MSEEMHTYLGRQVEQLMQDISNFPTGNGLSVSEGAFEVLITHPHYEGNWRVTVLKQGDPA